MESERARFDRAWAAFSVAVQPTEQGQPLRPVLQAAMNELKRAGRACDGNADVPTLLAVAERQYADVYADKGQPSVRIPDACTMG